MMSGLDPAFQKDALNLIMAVLLGGVIGTFILPGVGTVVRMRLLSATRSTWRASMPERRKRAASDCTGTPA